MSSKIKLSLITMTIAVVVICASTCKSMGSNVKGDRIEVVQKSPQWDNESDRFINAIARVEPGFWKISWKWITGEAKNNVPENKLPIIERSAKEFQAIPKELHVTWLGHSTMILEIDGQRFLIDPVWGKRVSPFTYIGPKRFHKTPMPMSELLKIKIDAIVISHDHYDHLDHPTIIALGKTGVQFVVPLGVGAHIQGWGVPKDQITELDWWQGIQIGNVKLTATPARHFSGRSLIDRDSTLWASWSFIGNKHRAFFSGDTAMFPGFKEIGDRLGPFDLTMLEVGAYNQLWADVHMGPEQAVQAHIDLRGKSMLPVHWGTFDLALHSWTEPMERTIVAAQNHNISVLTPQPGQSLYPTKKNQVKRWWPKVPGQTAPQAPVVSSGLGQTKAKKD